MIIVFTVYLLIFNEDQLELIIGNVFLMERENSLNILKIHNSDNVKHFSFLSHKTCNYGEVKWVFANRR